MIEIEPADERLLLKAMREGRVALVLGAGASVTSTNVRGEHVRQGRSLAELLAGKGGLAYVNDELTDVITAVVGSRISREQFNNLLLEEYNRVDPSPELQALLNYTWHRIYSWNIDDALANAPSSTQRRKYFNALADKVSACEG